MILHMDFDISIWIFSTLDANHRHYGNYECLGSPSEASAVGNNNIPLGQ